MGEIVIKRIKTPAGELLLGSFDGKLCLCDWAVRKNRDRIDRRIQKDTGAGFSEGVSPILDSAEKQLEEYFSGNRRNFDIPLLTAGTEFQRAVWQELLKVPYGETLTYGALSKRFGNEKAVRAVAAAVGANAISIIIPCHRITGRGGELTGYAGGLPAKEKLLRLEAGYAEQV